MRISEIVVENDVGDVANLSASNVKTGFDKVSKLLSPSKWFSGNVDKSTDSQEKVPGQRVVRTSHLDRETLVNASQGGALYRDDLMRLKSLYQKVSAGKIKSANPTELADALKVAYKGGKLTSEQQSLLAQLAKQL